MCIGRRYALFVAIAMPSWACAQVLHWVIALGVSGESEINHVRTDDQDNVYILGTKNNSGSIDLDPSPGSQLLSWDFGQLPGSGRFVAKYDSLGHYQWGYRADDLRGITVSPSGSVVVLAYVQGSWDADPGPGVHQLSAAEGLGVARWTTDGEFVSAFVISGAHARHCETDDAGNIVLLGNFLESIDADPGGGVQTLVSNGYYDVWIGRYDAQNVLDWAYAIGGPGQEYSSDLVVNGNNLLMTLRTVGDNPVEQFDTDPGPDTAMTDLSQNQGAVLIGLAPDGNYQRHRSFDWPVDWRAPIVRLLPDFGVALAGSYSGSAQFEASDSVFTLPSSGLNAFINRLYGSWDPGWVDVFSADGSEVIYAMVPAKDGAVLVCGMFTHTIDVDPGPEQLLYTNTPPGSAWIGAYCYEDGSRIWSALVDGEDRDLFHAMTWSAADALVIGGKSSTGADLGLGGPPHVLYTTASSSAIVARYRGVDTHCATGSVDILPDGAKPVGVALHFADGSLDIRLGGAGRHLALIDTQGRLIQQRWVQGDHVRLSVHDKPSGVYLVVISSSEGRVVLPAVLW